MSLSVLAGTASAATWYVDTNIAAAQANACSTFPSQPPGQAWESAFPTIQDALAVAGSGDVIKVANGRYDPGPSSSDTYVIPSGVQLRGGFRGLLNTLEDNCMTDSPDDQYTQSEISDRTTPVEYDHFFTLYLKTGVVIEGFSVIGLGTGGGTSGSGLQAVESEVTVRGCTFSTNNNTGGGACYFENCDFLVDDCVFQKCGSSVSPINGGAILVVADETGHSMAVEDSNFDTGRANQGAGIFLATVSGSDLVCARSRFYAQQHIVDGGEMYIYSGHADVFDSIFEPGEINGAGAAIYVAPDGTADVSDSLINGGFAPNGGGGIYVAGTATVNVGNCTIVNCWANSSHKGAGIYVEDDGVCDVANSILWQNGWSSFHSSTPYTYDLDGQLFVVVGGAVTVNYTDTEYAPWPVGSGNISADPLFVSLSGDFHLTDPSPCFNLGDNGSIFGLNVDLDNTARIKHSYVDMGAYELCPCPADFNRNGDIGTDQDIEAFFAALGGGSQCQTCLTADVNCDGDVGTDQDVEYLFFAIGGGC